jgi:hypothetical protein
VRERCLLFDTPSAGSSLPHHGFRIQDKQVQLEGQFLDWTNHNPGYARHEAAKLFTSRKREESRFIRSSNTNDNGKLIGFVHLKSGIL